MTTLQRLMEEQQEQAEHERRIECARRANRDEMRRLDLVERYGKESEDGNAESCNA